MHYVSRSNEDNFPRANVRMHGFPFQGIAFFFLSLKKNSFF